MNYYITTPLYYPSSRLHIGHAYTTVLCDTFVRYLKLAGHNVFFTTGSDEHGEKIQKIAIQNKKTPQVFVDEIVATFKTLWKDLDINYDAFIRTTDPKHAANVTKIFKKMYDNGDIYKGIYSGLYCVHDEAFWTESQLINGNCPDCGRPVEEKKEDAYFFRMSKYTSIAKKILEDPSFLANDHIRHEMLNNFVSKNLNDLCISRSSFDWGIPLPIDKDQVIYVWLDALNGYLSALGFDLDKPSASFNKYWNEGRVIHVIAKEISRFHTIYWPIFLNSIGVKLPNEVFVHGWIILKDGKMSKSKGNLVSPYTLINRYGSDALRYFLVSEITPGSDLVFSSLSFVNRINNDLVNDYANLFKRTLTMVHKYLSGVVSASKGVTPLEKSLYQLEEQTISLYHNYMLKLDACSAFEAVFKYIDYGNGYIEDTKPWELYKNADLEGVKRVLYNLVRILFKATIMLSPNLVNISKKAIELLGLDSTYLSFKYLDDISILNNLKVNEPISLFQRLVVDDEVKYIDQDVK